MLSRSLILKASALKPVERIVRKSFVFRGLVKRFIAGDTLEEALVKCEELAAKGFHISLDLLGENVTTVEEAVASKQAYMAMLEAIHQSPCASKTNISIKLTQCGFDQGDDLAEKHYHEVLERARELGDYFVRVDMEASAYTERTMHMLARAWENYKNTGTVLQSYLYRTAEDAETAIRWGMRIRLVKGAYLEPPSVAFPEKAKVDEEYVKVGKRLLLDGNYPALATHDESIISQLKEFAEKEGIGKDRFEFQMLCGIRRDLQESLLAEGFNVRIYVPFGDRWYPYFTRRLAERPANMIFILKSLFRP